MTARDRPSNHVLVVLALLSLFSFVGIGDRSHQWLWVSLRVVGCGAALSAAYGYSQEEETIQSTDEHTRLLEVANEVREGYEWQQYNLQLQHQREIEQYEQVLAQLQTQLQAAEVVNFDQMEAERERLALDYDRLQKERERLTQEQALLEEHYDRQQQALEAREAALREQEEAFEAAMREQIAQERDRLQAQEDALNERERLMLQHFEQEWAEREEFYAAIADAAVQESYSLKKPDLPRGTSHEELLAREAIRCLYEHGIVVKKPFVRPLPRDRFELCFEVLPVLVDGKLSTPIRSSGEALKKIEKDLLKPLRIAVPGCCADPIAEPIDGGLKLTFDVSGTDWEALERDRKARADAIHDPDPSHLATFVKENPQICLMGDSGEGKTTLINNLILLMEQDLGENVGLILTNPKPNEETDLSKLKYADFDSSIFGLLEAATEILYRLDLNTNALLERRTIPDNPLPIFTPLIYFFDEFSEIAGVWNRCKPEVMEEVLDEFAATLPPEKLHVMDFIRKRVSPSSFAGDLLKFCWRVGRSEKVKLLIAGQNLKASSIGVLITDLNQTAILYLGEAIREGIETRISSWQKESLNQEYAHRSQKVAEKKANRFYGLFVPKGSKAYFSTLPDEFAFSQDNASLETVQRQDEPAPDAPTAPGAPDLVQELERLWHLPSKGADPDRTGEDRTRTNAVPDPFDPLDPEINSSLTEAVLKNFDVYKSQTKVIEMVWNVGKSGTSNKYRAAKWKLRRILKKHDRNLPGKSWGEDPDDFKKFHEIL
ncbi:hypothetical protein H6F90_03675 [Trichocoleus sp. FACHB-591]|uniref:hypothetical protein n=1 Tax=Trichocoleus sp. FACHB-591 TaxID=2692872 RepID=UPI00168834DB|nr:hypothetical protein [Trichocoleus sp. FACHB-591]MBD2094246.1 hypothetical protein [Trichocoleus sp. FACHB-591]